MNIDAAVDWVKTNTNDFTFGSEFSRRDLCRAGGVVHPLDTLHVPTDTDETYAKRVKKHIMGALTMVEKTREILLKEHGIDLVAIGEEKLRVMHGSQHIRHRSSEASRDARRAIKKGVTHVMHALTTTAEEERLKADQLAHLGAQTAMLRKRTLKF